MNISRVQDDEIVAATAVEVVVLIFQEGRADNLAKHPRLVDTDTFYYKINYYYEYFLFSLLL